MHSKDGQGPKTSSCGQRTLWSDWVDAKADPSLHWAHSSFSWFCHALTQMTTLINSFLFCQNCLVLLGLNRFSCPCPCMACSFDWIFHEMCPFLSYMMFQYLFPPLVIENSPQPLCVSPVPYQSIRSHSYQTCH